MKKSKQKKLSKYLWKPADVKLTKKPKQKK